MNKNYEDFKLKNTHYLECEGNKNVLVGTDYIVRIIKEKATPIEVEIENYLTKNYDYITKADALKQLKPMFQHIPNWSSVAVKVYNSISKFNESVELKEATKKSMFDNDGFGITQARFDKKMSNSNSKTIKFDNTDLYRLLEVKDRQGKKMFYKTSYKNGLIVILSTRGRDDEGIYEPTSRTDGLLHIYNTKSTLGQVLKENNHI